MKRTLTKKEYNKLRDTGEPDFDKLKAKDNVFLDDNINSGLYAVLSKNDINVDLVLITEE